MPKAKYKKRADGRYSTNVTLGTNPDGSRNRKAIYAHSIAELERKKTEIMLSKMTGYKPTNQSFREYTGAWLDTYKSNRRTNTRVMYERVLRTHILPEIGDCPLKDVSSTLLQQLINSRADRPRTCEIIRLTLRQIVRRAYNDGLIAKDVTFDLTVPKRTKREKRALYPHEKAALGRADLDSTERCLVNLLYACGLRREELLGLQIGDIKRKEHTLTVSRVVVFDIDGLPIVEECTKSESGKRTVPIPAEIYQNIVLPYITPDIWNSNTFLFRMKNGKPLSKSSYRRTWERIVRKLNEVSDEPIVGLTAYTFRHNYATNLYYSNISLKKAADLMGHTDTKLIMEVYAHLDETRENTADKLNNFFSSAL